MVRQIREAEKIGAELHAKAGNSHLCAAIMPDKFPGFVNRYVATVT